MEVQQLQHNKWHVNKPKIAYRARLCDSLMEHLHEEERNTTDAQQSSHVGARFARRERMRAQEVDTEILHCTRGRRIALCATPAAQDTLCRIYAPGAAAAGRYKFCLDI